MVHIFHREHPIGSNMVLNLFLLFLGIGLLYWGSEWMVKGSASLALSFSIRPAIVGATVVAFATSAPELFVSLIAAFKESKGISLGNILGSNVANIGLVLGTSALIKALIVDNRLIRREVPIMVGVSALFWVTCLDGYLGRIDGFILLAAMTAFLVISVMTARQRQAADQPTPVPTVKNNLRFTALILLGMGGLILGADLMVRAAVFFAECLGLSELFIGLSIVAVGTSLPELATSAVAGARGQHDISVGNVVGSNIFNICLVIGTLGLFSPMSVEPGLMRFEFPCMFFLAVSVWLFSSSRFTITRMEGLFLLVGFFAFVGISYWRSS